MHDQSAHPSQAPDHQGKFLFSILYVSLHSTSNKVSSQRCNWITYEEAQTAFGGHWRDTSPKRARMLVPSCHSGFEPHQSPGTGAGAQALSGLALWWSSAAQ